MKTLRITKVESSITVENFSDSSKLSPNQKETPRKKSVYSKTLTHNKNFKQKITINGNDMIDCDSSIKKQSGIGA